MSNIHRLSRGAVILVFIQCFSCISGKDYGPLETEKRNISDFSEIEISHGIDVYLSMDSKESLVVEVPENLKNHLITEVKGDKLKIYFDKFLNWHKETRVYVKAKKIDRISASGGSDLTGEHTLEGKDLELKASGGSDIKLDVHTEHLEVNISGGADVALSGKTEFLYANTSGGSDLKAFDLVAERAELEASGGSDIKVFVEEEIKAKASGGADIEYMGTPHIVDTNTSSSADIRNRN
ncbi:MAG: DUF2807 domain-containing protein [Cytophagales bacterium]|nr:DUF2807 domain-containing protein [Cytophagales bacterium]